jgi:hypothetical protein
MRRYDRIHLGGLYVCAASRQALCLCRDSTLKHYWVRSFNPRKGVDYTHCKAAAKETL